MGLAWVSACDLSFSFLVSEYFDFSVVPSNEMKEYLCASLTLEVVPSKTI